MKVGRPPKPSSPEASRRMKANVSQGTGPELQLRKALWEAGCRGYRLNWRKAFGSPDIAFPGKRIAIFVNGCYWHECPFCMKTPPKQNRDFWERKFKDNSERDERVKRALEREGWTVIVAWECRIKEDVDEVVSEIRRAYDNRN